MKKYSMLIFISAILILLTGCPELESAGSVSSIKVLLDGAQVTSIDIEEGQVLTLKADVGLSSNLAFIVWQFDNKDDEDIVQIVSNGEGPECALRGRATGSAELTIKAWRSGQTPVVITLPVNVEAAVVTGIDITGFPDRRIGVGEKQILIPEITPPWAQYTVSYSAAPSGKVALTEAGGVWSIEGLEAGSVTLTVETDDAENFKTEIPFTVLQPEDLTSLAIFHNGVNISDTSSEPIQIGVFEEIILTTQRTPSGAFTFYTWTSSAPQNISVDSNGVIKGLLANSEAKITVTASNLSASVNVAVANPVTGVRIRYDNEDKLQVTNLVWLYATAQGNRDFVELEATLMPDEIQGEITWEYDASFLQITHPLGDTKRARLEPRPGTSASHSGINFENPPLLVRVTARNEFNGTRPASATIQVKILDNEPLWAWDRARDAGGNTDLKRYGTEPGMGKNITPFNSAWTQSSGARAGIPHIYETPAQATEDGNAGAPYENDGGVNTRWRVMGRGVYAKEMWDDYKFNLKRAAVVYNEKGLYFNSASAAMGGNPLHTVNSTCLIIGSDSNMNTTSNSPGEGGTIIFGRDVPGVFDFSTIKLYRPNEETADENGFISTPINVPIRISVDLEVVQSSGRRFVVFVNNNFTATLANPLGQNCRPLYRPITEAAGTRLTLATNFLANDFWATEVPGHFTLPDSFVSLVYESQGGKIFISGIRIEYGVN